MSTAERTPATEVNLNDADLFMLQPASTMCSASCAAMTPSTGTQADEVSNGFWSITKYEDMLFISRHPDLFISSQGHRRARPAPGGPRRDDGRTTRRAAAGQGNVSIITMDPPRHVKMRRLVNKGFTPRAVNAMEPQIRQITNEILDEIAGRGSAATSSSKSPASSRSRSSAG